MRLSKSKTSAISRAIVAVLVIIVIIIAGVGVYLAVPRSSPLTTTSSTISPTSSTGTGSTSSSATTSSSTPSGQELIVDEGSAPTTGDPAAAIDNNGLELAQNTNLPLTFCANPSCTTLIPVLATSWTQSPNGLNYTFELRSNVYYNNGDPFNAYVVWYNIYRDLYINQAADFIFFAYLNASGVSVGDVNSLNNAQNSPGSNSTLMSIMHNPNNGVTVLNSTSVQFHLTNAFVAFIQSIDTAPWVFVDPFVVQQHGGVAVNQPNSWMSINGTTVGDGPYITQSYVVNQFAELEANPHYWAQNMTGNLILEPAKIHTVLINYKTDELTRTEDLESNKVQASIVAFNDISNVLKACPSTCYIPNTGTSGTIEWINIDALKAPTNNTLVRRAMISAINISQIESVVYQGYAQPVVGPMPSIFNYYNSSIRSIPYNVTAAKQLMTQAGYPGGAGFPTINLIYYTSSYAQLVATIVKQDLAQIGINLNVEEETATAVIGQQNIPGQNSTAAYMILINWTYYPDFSAYEFILDQALNTFGNFHNQTMLNLILESNTQINPTLRAQEISQITNIAAQQAGFIWLGQDLDLFDTGGGIGPTIWNNCVSGMWYNTAFNGVDFNNVTLTCTPT